MISHCLFLTHIQLTGTNVLLPKNTQDTSWGWLWVLKISNKVWVVKQTKSLHGLPSIQAGGTRISWWIEMLVPVANWTTWHSVVGEQACEISHKMDSGMWQDAWQGCFLTLITKNDFRQYCHLGNTAQHCRLMYSCSTFLLASSQYRSTLVWPFPSCRKTRYCLCVRFLPLQYFSVAPAEIRDSNIFVCSPIITLGLHSRSVHPNSTWSRIDVDLSISTLFINFFHMGSIVLLLSSHFDCHPHFLTKITHVFDEGT